jgi:hypothetical protein
MIPRLRRLISAAVGHEVIRHSSERRECLSQIPLWLSEDNVALPSQNFDFGDLKSKFFREPHRLTIT